MNHLNFHLGLIMLIHRMDWVKDVPNWKKHLPEEFMEVIEVIGEDNFLKLWGMFVRTSVRFSEKPLNTIRKEYLKLYFRPGKADQLARLLGVSDKFIFDCAPRKTSRSDEQMGN